MQKIYTYKEQNYSNLYELSEVLGKDGVFIPLSIGDEALAELGVTVTHDEEPLENVKQRKIIELKRLRDTAEVEPIAYNGHSFDYDDKARDRINAAIIALDVQSKNAETMASIDWTTADNKDVQVTADDLRMVIASVAQRSNALHIAYRVAREKVEQASTQEEIEAITLEVEV